MHSVFRKFVVIISSCTIAVTAWGQGPQSSGFDLSPSGQFIAISVRNLDETIAWYQRNLGFVILQRMAAPDSSSRTAILTNNSIVIEVMQQKNGISKDDFKKQADFLWHGVFKTGFYVTSIQRVLDQLEKNGVPIFIGPVTDNKSKLKYFMVRDNERNILQFLESLE
jgi:catechol 2,3-dioxygenase-like lactoylglutathione lyase family enzyme